MPSSAFSELVQLVHAKHDEGERPYVLFLGAAASLSSGCSTLSDTAKGIIGSDDPVTFFDFLDRHTYGERALFLGKYLRGSSPSSGYCHLAILVKAGYFDIILTTNVDSLLETSSADAGLRHLQDHVCIVDGKGWYHQFARSMMCFVGYGP